MKIVWLSLALSAVAGAQSAVPAIALQPNGIPVTVPHDFTVFEFRRYIVIDGARDRFATYFDAYFPEGFEQAGAISVGQGKVRDNPNGFTWIRGFHTLEERANINGAFYFGPLWHEHKKTANDLLADNDNVLLLTPLSPDRQPIVYPAVDPVTEASGAHGVIVAQIFAIQPNQVDAFVHAAEPAFARYRAVAGVREDGVLKTLDVPNNFPILKLREDGPYLVWVGVVKDDATLEHGLQPLVDRAVSELTATGMLRSKPEWVVMDPTHRSRLRWWTGGNNQ